MEFQFVFAKENFDILPEHCKWDCAIKLIPGVEPKSLKVYSLSSLEQAKLDIFLEENLHTRWIWPSKFPIAAPMFFIKKKDGLLQLVQDYHTITLYKCLGKISDNLYPNNQNNWLERRAQPPQRCSLDAQSWTWASSLSSRVVAVTTAIYTS